ncbi:MAG: MBOAT family protein [Acidaminococcaceae bacterium]|nr:MBOAT family protein [Acidaminococcaceae bacterium]
MLFNSYEFIFLFLPVVLLGYYGLAKRFGANWAKGFLIFASLCFYSYWDIQNLPVLLFSIAANIFFGRMLTKKKSKIWLAIGVAFNLCYLGIFKYTDFVIGNLNMLFNSDIPLQKLVLPLGISFFTFTQTAYLVDVYRGETKEYQISDYLLFVTIFPHLIAGPILYHKDMIPQFMDKLRYKINYENMTYGIFWFTIGLFKKVIIADKLAVYANKVFETTGSIAMLDAWFGSLAYTLQLYFDFSGYSEMAIGLGLMLNFNLPWNFNYPYRATSIIEFWKRWHITLSTFLKNYLYIPLGGNRGGLFFHLRNIMITMLLGGLWHGAGWTFVFWGGIHGMAICINHLWRKTKINLPKWVNWLLTFNVVNLAWIFFRAESFDKAMKIIRAMGDVSTFYVHNKYLGKYFELFATRHEHLVTPKAYIGIPLLILLSMFVLQEKKIEKLNPYISAVVLGGMFIYCVLKFGTISEFLYFQF